MAGWNDWVKSEIKKLWKAIESIPAVKELHTLSTVMPEIDYSKIEIPDIGEIKQSIEILDAAVLNSKKTLGDQLNQYNSLNEDVNNIKDLIEELTKKVDSSAAQYKEIADILKNITSE